MPAREVTREVSSPTPNDLLALFLLWELEEYIAEGIVQSHDDYIQPYSAADIAALERAQGHA